MPGATSGTSISSTAQIADGVIVNADVNASAAIAESKLAFATNDGSRHDHDAADITGGTLSVTRGGTGLSNPTAKSLLVGAGASALAYIAPGSAGQVLTSDGTDWAAGAAPASLVLSSVTDTNHTGTTSETTLYTATLPANSMGANGLVRITVDWDAANDGGGAGNQNLQIKFGGTAFCSHVRSSTSGSSAQISIVEISSANSTSAQEGHNRWWKNDGATSGIQFGKGTTAAIDTTANVTISVTGTLNNSAHHIQVTRVTVECFKKS